jgi:hypothetical protein
MVPEEAVFISHREPVRKITSWWYRILLSCVGHPFRGFGSNWNRLTCVTPGTPSISGDPRCKRPVAESISKKLGGNAALSAGMDYIY